MDSNRAFLTKSHRERIFARYSLRCIGHRGKLVSDTMDICILANSLYWWKFLNDGHQHLFFQSYLGVPKARKKPWPCQRRGSATRSAKRP